MSEPANLKKIREAAEAMGMETFVSEGTFVKPAVYYKNTTDNNKAGDVRTPEKSMPKHVLRARHPDAPSKLAFEAVFAGGFQDARMIDPVGKPMELFFDYSKHVPEGWTKDYARERAQEMDRAYNDGHMWVKTRYYIQSATELYQWLDDMLEAMGVSYKKLTPNRKLKKDRTLMDDVMDAVNS